MYRATAPCTEGASAALMDVLGGREGLAQDLDPKALLLGCVEDDLFLARQKIDRRRQLGGKLVRDHHGAVTVGMDQISVHDGHAEDIDRHAPPFDMDVGMAGADLA